MLHLEGNLISVTLFKAQSITAKKSFCNMNSKTFILDFLYVQLSERIPSLVNPKHDQAPGPAALSQCRTRWPTELVVPALLPFLLFPFGVMPLLRSVHSHPKCQKYLTLAYLGILSSPPNSQSWASIICHGKIPR